MAKNDFPDHLHYEPDHLFCDSHGRYRYEHQLWDRAQDWALMMVDFALARGENVVVSDVLPTGKDVAPYLRLAEAHGASTKIIVAANECGNTHSVPVFVLDRMRAMFEYNV